MIPPVLLYPGFFQIVTAAALLLAGSLVAGGVLLERRPEEPHVEITSHRAGPSPAPENTLAALKRSIRAGSFSRTRPTSRRRIRTHLRGHFRMRPACRPDGGPE